ncbi:gamma-glutamyl-gamma-aminobutyrate hydrolase family protein [Flammeovirga sp. EKP202]|uniref:gamma-glutamyl-gamma-aminobutyrate hydrolase family protein n=1 Tax=Flammeovirga sp. EKP202 TaxID=2770592 RepID=UPI00165F734F|nr:gamma-glutamyl-gamma-aminobutyrate hydrolase family protein [Flammeovirga sp. EKP202]MBD0405102.1 gamma-glutamyl-gamma-aminobutyrate hydrolase family protein [Flammeovirga sp. EKP202]
MINIGITPSFMYPDVERPVYGPKSLTYIENDMMDYVAQHGVLPILLPDISDDRLYPILQQLHGVILQGGVDIAPETYGETPIGPWKGDQYRDEYELKIIDFAINNGKPLLGICRGFQLMNVYFGGTLYQDTKTQRQDVNHHRDAQQYDRIKHPLIINEDTFFGSLYPDHITSFVNTVHHQAVKDLGKDLEVWATSDDGLIEAFGYTKEKPGKVMGVQWHPEFTPTLQNEIIDSKPIIDTFLSHV